MDIFALIDIFLKIIPLLKKGFHWIVNRIKWHGISEDVRKIALAFNSYSWVYLQQTPLAIDFVGVIERPEINQIRQCWQLSDQPIILYGEAGAGKSGIALRLGQLMATDGIPTFFIKASDLPRNQDPIVTIQNRMPLKDPLLDSIASLCKERECVIIIDQLDSVAATDLCKSLVGFIKTLVALPQVKVLIVSRTYELQHDPDISSLNFQKIESGQLAVEQVASYLSQIGIESPSQELVELARNLLHLSLIAEAAKSSTNHILDLTDDIDLWKQYYLTIQQREGEEIADYVLKLAQEVTSRGEHTFSVSFPKSEYRRKLLSRCILIDAPGRRYTFRHEQLQDFLCAYSLMPKKLEFNEILRELGKNGLKEGVLKWLHKLYHVEFPDEEASFVDYVLAANEDLPFYTRASIL